MQGVIQAELIPAYINHFLNIVHSIVHPPDQANVSGDNAHHKKDDCPGTHHGRDHQKNPLENVLIQG